MTNHMKEPQYSILNCIIRAAGWQGGTIHQAIEYARKNGHIGTSAYMLGLNMGLDIRNPKKLHYNPQLNLIDCGVPENSFSNLNRQVPDYVLGLINSGMEEVQHDA